MRNSQAHKGTVFRDLHTSDDIFVMPNGWNAGSACMLEAAGFSAIGTTSAGIAFCLGLPDYEGALSRDAALEETRRIASAVDIPVSADGENGYGHAPGEVAESIRLFAEAGAVGASIGGSLARTTFAVIRQAAEEIRDQGTFGFSQTQVPDDELCQFFATREK